MEKKMETTVVYWGNIGIMEKKMETTVVYWGNIGKDKAQIPGSEWQNWCANTQSSESWSTLATVLGEILAMAGARVALPLEPILKGANLSSDSFGGT